MVAVIGGVRARGASGVVSVHALVSTAAHAIAQHDLLVSISRLRRRGEGPCRVAAKSEPERGQGLYSPRLWYAHRSGSEPARSGVACRPSPGVAALRRSWSPTSIPYRSKRACHPERRRREGPAFPQMRRTSDAKDLSFVRADHLRGPWCAQLVRRQIAYV